jgi:tRNA(adenine34) deaminase
MDRATAESWMREALVEARKAEAENEVPIGALLLINEKIVARAHNRSIAAIDPTAHAEILALRNAACSHQNYRLPGTIMVVTMEPCIMCVGAMVHARVEEVIYGAKDPKSGAMDSHFHLADAPQLNHTFKVTGGILAEECGSLLQAFFQKRRNHI